MSKLKHLFQKGQIGNLELKNRIVMSPMGTYNNFSYPLDQKVIDYYVARAKGGCGLVIVNPAYPVKGGGPLDVSDDKCIPYLKELTDAVHEAGGKIGLALLHNGKYATFGPIGPVSPSPIYSEWSKRMPRELSNSEIKEIVKNFARGAGRAKEAGFDLVHYNAYSGYLIREFLCSLTNIRTDEYGGNIEQRTTFLREIIEQSRKEVGEDFPLDCRISGDEFLPGGNGLEEAKVIARVLEKAGISSIFVSPGGHETGRPINAATVPRGAFVYLAAAIKKEVNVPILTAHIGDVFLADQVLKKGEVDFVVFGRQFLADPEFPNKARAGRFSDIRRCERCCTCFDTTFGGHFASAAGMADTGPGSPIPCARNPELWQKIEKPTRESKRVLVIGGGPGGIEAARVATLRGHKVTLCEKGRRLGGLTQLAGVVNKELEGIASYMQRQLKALPVDIRTRTEVTPALVQKLKPDVVILATGGAPSIPKVPGVEGSNVISAHEIADLLDGHSPRKAVLWRLGSLFMRYFFKQSVARWFLKFNFPIKKRVVIVGGGYAGCEIAWALVEKGKEVTIIEESGKVGSDIGLTTRGALRRLLREAGVKMETNTKVEEITGRGLEVSRDGRPEFFKADTVVLARGLENDVRLAQELEGKITSIYTIGDAVNPRGKIKEAISSGFNIGNSI